MNLEVFIARRILSPESSGFSRAMLRIALGSISLGLAVMILSVAIVTGFQDEIRAKVSGFEGHIRIVALSSNYSPESSPVSFSPMLYSDLENQKDIVHYQHFATKPGIIRKEGLMEGTVFKGVAGDFDSSFFFKHLVEGRMPQTGDSSASPDVLISQWLANRLELKSGDNCDIYFTTGNTLRPRRLTVCGIYNSGLFELDKQVVVGDIIHLQRINGWEADQFGGIEIQLKNISRMDQAREEILGIISHEHNAETIRQRYAQIFSWLDLLDLNVYVILILMVLVASINMITTLLIIIIEKTRLIGILKALGSPDWSIRKVFLINAGILISRGLLWGNLAGIGLCLLQLYTGAITLDPESYYVSVVPINLNIWHLLLLNFGTVLICVLMLIFPSHLITRLSPVKAIKVD